jgi:hypothetical protein
LFTDIIGGMRNACVIYGCYLVMVAMHEAGHWTAASLSRFPIGEFRVGPFQWLSETGWGAAWRGRNILTGIVRVRLTRYKSAFGFRYVTFQLAGPFANFLTGLYGLFVFSRLPRSDGAEFLALWSAASLVLGLLSLMPARNGTQKTDGLALFNAVFRGNLRKIRFAVCYIETADELKGALRGKDFVRAKEIAEAELVLAKGISDTDGISKMLEALHKITAFTERDIPAVESAPLASPQLTEA